MPEDNKGAPLSAPLASDALLLLLPATSPCLFPSLSSLLYALRDGSGCRFFVLLASSPPVLPIFSVHPSISFADLFCRL